MYVAKFQTAARFENKLIDSLHTYICVLNFNLYIQQQLFYSLEQKKASSTMIILVFHSRSLIANYKSGVLTF